MYTKNFAWLPAVLIATVVVTSVSWSVTSVYAANIICAGNVGQCAGTDQADSMIGDEKANIICGRAGNDNIDLRDGGDRGEGAGGNDIINGGYGEDFIVGDSTPNCRGGPTGADRLLGGPGNDQLFHGSIATANPDTQSDEQRDYIDCGPGIDRADINTSVDGDVAIHCETVNSG